MTTLLTVKGSEFQANEVWAYIKYSRSKGEGTTWGKRKKEKGCALKLGS